MKGDTDYNAIQVSSGDSWMPISNNNYGIVWATFPKMYDACVDYYLNRLGNQRDKCDGYRERFVGEVNAQVKHLKAVAALYPLINKQIGARIDADWRWREAISTATDFDFVMPPLRAAADAVQPMLGDDPQKAFDVAYAGATPLFQKTVRSEWNQQIAIVRKTYLPTSCRRISFSGGAYGCPNSTIPVGQSCVKKVDATFDSYCLPLIADAHVYAASPTALMFSTYTTKCRTALQGLTGSANALAVAPQDLTASLCRTSAQTAADPSHREADAKCRGNAETAWASCAQGAYDKGQDVNAARACYQSYINMTALTGAKLTPMPAKPVAPLHTFRLLPPQNQGATPPAPDPTKRP